MNFIFFLKKPSLELVNQFFRFFNLKLFVLPAYFSVLFTYPANSQQKSDSLFQKNDANKYILRYDSVISVRINANSEIDFFEIKGEGFHYDIRPNISISNKISVHYRFISLGVSFTPNYLPGNNDNDLQGETKTFSMGLELHPNNWIQELRYTRIKGFYLYNTREYNPKWSSGKDPYITFPDLSVQYFRGSTGYKFNPNFSISAISSLTERQIKSAGSFIPILNYDYHKIDNKTGNPLQQTSQTTNNFSLIASFGYIYTLVLSSKFYASAGIFPGGGFQYIHLLTHQYNEDFKTNYTDPVFRLAEKAAIGYNSKKFFTGAEISLSQASHVQNNSSVQTSATRAYFQVFLGYRFNAPSFIKRETDLIKKHSFGIIKE
jgi:hypothetical protein